MNRDRAAIADGRELAAVVARAQCGHRSSLDRALRHLQDPLYRHIASFAADDDAIRDVLQDVLWTVARTLPQLRDPRLFRAWAYRIATRLALRKTRRERMWTDALREPAMASIPDPAPDASSDDAVPEEARALLATVPGVSGVVLRMYYIDDLSYAEIADALDIPLGTVKSRIAYGLTVLRRDAGISTR